MHGMLQFFETIPTKYTWTVNAIMNNANLTSLKNIVGVSLYR